MNNLESKKAQLVITLAFIIVGTIGAFRAYIPLSSTLVVFFRGSIGCLTLIIYTFLIKKEKFEKISKENLIYIILSGISMGLNWMCLFEAYNYTTVAKASLANYMAPTILILISPFAFKEKLTLKKLLCAFISLFGMILVSDVLVSSAKPENDSFGIILGLMAAFLYVLFMIFNKRIKDVNSLHVSIIQLLSASIVIFPSIIISNSLSGAYFDFITIILVIIVGVVHTGIFYAMMFWSIPRLSAQTYSMISYTEPVVAMLVSAFFLNENMTIFNLIGGVLIIGAALVSEIKLEKK